MPSQNLERTGVDELLHDAGAQWRARQVFEAVPVSPHSAKRSRTVSSGVLGPAIGLAAVLAVAGVLVAAAPALIGRTGVWTTASAGAPGPTATDGGAPTLVDVEAALMPVVEAVNTHQEDFGIPYLDKDGVLVVQFVSEDARADLEGLVPPGLSVRWEKVDYSRAHLRRIAADISDLRLEGVSGVSSGTTANRVVVKVFPGASLDNVSRALQSYGDAVVVEYSSDLPIVGPAGPTANP